MMISYMTPPEDLGPDDLKGFFQGWAAPPGPRDHLRILRGSGHALVAMDGGRVVGFITAITDGTLAAYIPLLEVLPEYRGRGIGSELVRRMLGRLGGLNMVDLMCDAPLRPFYERFGMVAGTGMMIRRHRPFEGEGADRR